MDDRLAELVETWRNIIVGEGKSWVLFEHGTCVIFSSPVADPTAEATALLKEWGPVVPGTPAGDFDVIELQNHPGWVVTCHHPDILMYVGPEEFEAREEPDDLVIGLTGRARRHQDAEELRVVHVEA
jgi:hypothetical protein